MDHNEHAKNKHVNSSTINNMDRRNKLIEAKSSEEIKRPIQKHRVET